MAPIKSREAWESERNRSNLQRCDSGWSLEGGLQERQARRGVAQPWPYSPICPIGTHVGARVLLALAGFMSLISQEARAEPAGAAKLTVNTVSNTDDGDCEGPPNAGSGNCTLHEAIDDVNGGLADRINFHP